MYPSVDSQTEVLFPLNYFIYWCSLYNIRSDEVTTWLSFHSIISRREGLFVLQLTFYLLTHCSRLCPLPLVAPVVITNTISFILPTCRCFYSQLHLRTPCSSPHSCSHPGIYLQPLTIFFPSHAQSAKHQCRTAISNNRLFPNSHMALKQLPHTPSIQPHDTKNALSK